MPHLKKITWWQRHATPWERRLFIDSLHWQVTSIFQTNQNTYKMTCDSKINSLEIELLYCSNPQRNLTVAVSYTNYSYKNDMVYHSFLFACSVCFCLLVSFSICVSFVCVLFISWYLCVLCLWYESPGNIVCEGHFCSFCIVFRQFQFHNRIILNMNHVVLRLVVLSVLIYFQILSFFLLAILLSSSLAKGYDPLFFSPRGADRNSWLAKM